MISLDVIAGIYLPNFWAWIFLLFVLIAEALLLTLYLRKVLFDKKIYSCIIFSNSVTTFIGYYFLDEGHHGGHLFNWIPVYIYHGVLWEQTSLLLIASFIVTTILEAILNFIFLRKEYKTKLILKGTIMVNLATYIVGTIIILGYGFYTY